MPYGSVEIDFSVIMAGMCHLQSGTSPPPPQASVTSRTPYMPRLYMYISVWGANTIMVRFYFLEDCLMSGFGGFWNLDLWNLVKW